MSLNLEWLVLNIKDSRLTQLPACLSICFLFDVINSPITFIAGQYVFITFMFN